MRVTFYGGAEEVGRSCIVLEHNRSRIMLDCGIKLGEKVETPLISDDELKRIDNIIITHAHLDHSGYLPHVCSKGTNAKIYLTKPTHDLMGVLLADYYRIQKSKNELSFSMNDVNKVMQKSTMIEYNEKVEGELKFELRNAGHILGSAMVYFPENKILYTGDICMRKTRILDRCDVGLKAETLIVESTYGNKKDILPPLKESGQKLAKIINETIDRGGHVLIPSFAVGRAQEILLLLDDYMRSGAISEAKIYVDGMIGKAMKIYRHNAIYANDDIKRRILMSEDDPFKSKRFHKPRKKDRSDVLTEPSIIISTSGMLTGGPVLYYLEKLHENPANSLVFVGYQAPGTLGSKILEGERVIKIGDKEIELNMKIERVKISGHADYNELLQFIRSTPDLKRVFIIHGEKSELKDALEKKYEVITPRLLETYGF
ncbi:MAG: MBL fold metallo-hydrolase [Candidatus Bilamarchaeaceae archaeon]